MGQPMTWTIISANADGPRDLYTKCTVSTLTHYKDVKGEKKSKNGVACNVRSATRSLEIRPFDRAHMTSYSTLIETIRPFCTVFEYSKLFVKRPTLTYPRCTSCPL